jgi:hypothetical protein
MRKGMCLLATSDFMRFGLRLVLLFILKLCK